MSQIRRFVLTFELYVREQADGTFGLDGYDKAALGEAIEKSLKEAPDYAPYSDYEILGAQMLELDPK